MLRFLLALILAFTTVALPAQALCTADAPMALGCCCEAATGSDCAEIGDTCCGFSDQVPAAPQQSTVSVEPSAMATSQRAHSIVAYSEQLSKLSAAEERTKPLHLASNKLYLKKRSLLI